MRGFGHMEHRKASGVLEYKEILECWSPGSKWPIWRILAGHLEIVLVARGFR